MLEAAEGGEPVLVASILEPGPRDLRQGQRLLVELSGGRMGSLGDAALDELVADFAREAFREHFAGTVYAGGDGLSRRAIAGATSIYLEVVESRPVFLVVGAGHVGRAVARLAKFTGFEVAVIDDREDYANPELIPDADQVICDDFARALDAFPINRNTHVVLVTRGHKQDELSLRHCLGRGAAYLGMIGSRRRSATVIEHLLAEGFPLEELAKVRTPIGLDIGAESPEEIAVSILAEVIMLRNGGRGGPMYARPAHLREPSPAS
ncbi:MAG: XdhC/CoxI family protein [Dehalococcoidia bacterium]